MSFETKEQVLEKVLSRKRPLCPYCNQPMSLWEVPDANVFDGLGWGEPYLYVCFNDECSMYQEGWKNLLENYGRKASYRCMCYPCDGNYDCMTVYGPQGGHGQIIDDQVLEEQAKLEEKIEKGLARLDLCRIAGDRSAVLEILLDAGDATRVRVKAAEIIADIGELDAIDPLRNAKFGSPVLARKACEAIEKIHERHFTRECPFCAEIIKNKASVCKHCGREVGPQ